MNGIEHSFPLPETEAHKLDEVKEEITGHHPSRGQMNLGQAAPWLTVMLAAAGGIALGLWFNARETREAKVVHHVSRWGKALVSRLQR